MFGRVARRLDRHVLRLDQFYHVPEAVSTYHVPQAVSTYHLRGDVYVPCTRCNVDVEAREELNLMCTLVMQLKYQYGLTLICVASVYVIA